MTWAPRQAQVLRLLRAHRFMDAVQVHRVIYEPVSLRSCQRCLTLLYHQGLLVRVQPSRGGLGGGSSGYVYGLSAKGADVLEAIDDAPRKQIPYVKDPETFTPERVWHQLDVNRCFIALWRALEAVDGHELVRWNSDPHLRMRYQLAGRYQVIHPDGLAQVRSPIGDDWLFFEIDRGTNELRRYRTKVSRDARFWDSGAWRSEFPVFPELRIVTSRQSRVPRLVDAAEAGIRGLYHLDSRAVSQALRVAVAWAPAFLADPLGPVWEPTFSEDPIRQNLWRDPRREKRVESGVW